MKSMTLSLNQWEYLHCGLYGCGSVSIRKEHTHTFLEGEYDNVLIEGETYEVDVVKFTNNRSVVFIKNAPTTT